MEIDLDWIQKELDAGREVELECVDREGYEKRHCLNKTLFREGSCLEVLEVWDDGAINLKRLVDSPMDGLHLIPPHEFGHFRIKRTTPTFNDLIDLAFKALEDGVVKEIGLFDNILMIQESHEAGRVYVTINEVNQNGVCKYLEYIDSLYTETFVIENESDTNKLISGGKTVLKNGEVLEFSNNYKGTLYFNLNDYESDAFPFIALKGATVTQKRGKQ